MEITAPGAAGRLSRKQVDATTKFRKIGSFLYRIEKCCDS
jgi:hypothetical protein